MTAALPKPSERAGIMAWTDHVTGYYCLIAPSGKAFDIYISNVKTLLQIKDRFVERSIDDIRSEVAKLAEQLKAIEVMFDGA